MENIKNTALGVTSTEDGKENNSEHSVSELGEKVKYAQAMGLQPVPESKAVTPLDLRTEMFMLNTLRVSIDKEYITPEERYGILGRVISKCAEANGL